MEPNPKVVATLKRWKLKTLSQCIEATAVTLQMLVRVEAADAQGQVLCCSCGKKDHYKKMNGGHFVSRSFKSTILNRKNVHAQCVRCNCMNNTPGYALFLDSVYGKGTVDGLLAVGREIKLWTKPELAALRVSFSEEVKNHNKRITS